MTKKTAKAPQDEKKTAHHVSKEPGKKEETIKSAAAGQEEEKDESPAGGPKAETTTEEKLAELQDKYLRLSAEFDNYRKRTLREKMDLSKTAGEEILVQILQVMDDFDRAMKLIHDARDVEAVKTGIELIYQKLLDFLKIRGVKEIESLHKEFDTDFHEAVTKIPAPEKNLKGKVVDVVQKGYILHDKVIRYSKVVVGE